MRPLHLVASILLVGGVSHSPGADIDAEQARRLRADGVILALEDIVARAAALHPGRVLEAELEREDGHYVYEVEILGADRRVHEFEYDAATGERLKHEIED